MLNAIDDRITNLVKQLNISLTTVEARQLERKATLHDHFSVAYYNTNEDEIVLNMGIMKANSLDANHVLLHEIGHALGHSSRVARAYILWQESRGNTMPSFEDRQHHAKHSPTEELTANHFAYLMAIELGYCPNAALTFKQACDDCVLRSASLGVDSTKSIDDAYKALEFIRSLDQKMAA